MNAILVATVALAMSVSATAALAQQPRECGPREEMMAGFLQKHNESPVAGGFDQQGALVGYIREWDHRLLEWPIEAHDPKYRKQSASVNVSNTMGVQIIFENPRQEPPEARPERDQPPAIEAESKETEQKP